MATAAGVGRAAVACAGAADCGTAGAVAAAAEAVFHLSPPFQRSLAHALLAAGQLERLTPLLQGFMALASQPAAP